MYRFLVRVALILFLVMCGPLLNGAAQTLTIISGGETGTSGTNWNISSLNNVSTLTVSGTASINASVLEATLASEDLIIIGNSNNFRISVNQSISLTSGTGSLTLGSTTNQGTISITEPISLIGNLKVYGSKIYTEESLISKSGDILLDADFSSFTDPNATAVEIRGSGLEVKTLSQNLLSGATGTITVRGKGGSSNSSTSNKRAYGVYLTRGAKILTQSGDILISGEGGISTGAEQSSGVLLSTSNDSFGVSEVKSVDGTITINGTGGSGSNYAIGVQINNFAKVTTTGNGEIFITGTAGGAGQLTNHYGIWLINDNDATRTNPTASITAARGNIFLTGQSSNGAGIVLSNKGKIEALEGSISLTTSSLINTEVSVEDGPPSFPITSDDVISFGGNLTINQSGNSTFSGKLISSGFISGEVPGDGLDNDQNGYIDEVSTLIKSGNGTLTLTGINTFAGATQISGGTLGIVDDMNLGALPSQPTPRNLILENGAKLQFAVDVFPNNFTLNSNRGMLLANSGGELEVLSGVEVTYNGIIAGAGTLKKSGPSQLNIGAASTYTGGTIIQDGKLFGGAGSQTTPSFGTGPITIHPTGILWTDRSVLANNLVLNGGTLQGTNGFGEVWNGAVSITADSYVDVFINLRLNGAITGSGKLILNNSMRDQGEVVLAGTASHTGGTELRVGVLQVGAGGTTGSLSGNVSTSARSELWFNRSDADTFAGVVSGDGALKKMGAGALTLSGTNTFTGSTLVTAGRLNVLGSIASSVTAESGSILGGTGSISGLVTVNSGGTLAPGTSTGIFSLNGGLIMNSGSVLEVDINGNQPGIEHDQLSVLGAVNISDALLNPVFLSGLNQVENYPILLNDGADQIIGNFSGILEGVRFFGSGNERIQSGTYTGGTGNDFILNVINVSIQDPSITVNQIPNQVFSGTALIPIPVIKDGNVDLSIGSDYTVAYSNNTNVGTASVTITGTGNYTGTKTQTFSIVAKSASTLTIDPIASQTYTGSPITPTVVVKDGNTTLTLGTDYTVAYSSNTNVGTATVTITGIGNYTGAKTQTFTIVAKAASMLTIEAIVNQTYTGSAITPTVVVKDGNTTLTLGTDYTVAYSSNTNVGTATVTITGIGNYTGAKTQTFTIVAKAASMLTIEAIVNQTYTGSAITPTVVVKDGNTTLTLGTDYTVAYTSNTNVGTATVTITGTGNYTGTKTQTFSILAKAASTLTIEAIANQTYTGSAITPTAVVKDGNTTLSLGTDYTVAYTSNTNVGTATVTITGTGNYTGTKIQTFTIVAKAASTLTIEAIANQNFTGAALTPALVVKDGNTTLTLGTDYTVAYSSNTNVGTATVTITGTGNYSGTKTQTFAIVAKAASTLTIDAIANQNFTGAALTPALVVKDGNTTLTLGTDYTVAYSSNTNVGTATVTITGTGNYAGTKTQTFNITPKALTIRATNASKIYGEVNPSLSFTYSGLVAGDTEIDELPSISTPATLTSGVGSYRIILSGGADPNYTITRVEGTLEVTPAPLSLTVIPATKIYGQADPQFAYSIQGLKGADTDAVLRGTLTRESGDNPGVYRINQGTLSAGPNYTLNFIGSTLEITKARALSVVELATRITDWSKEVALPATVNVLSTHGQYYQIEVKWDKSTLNLFARGTYSLTGTLIPPVGIENPDKIVAKVTIQVLPKPAPQDLTINNNSFVGSTTQFFIPVGAFVVNDPVDNIHAVSFLSDGYDNKYFYIQDNVLYWNSAERAEGKTAFSIVVRVTDRDGNTLDKFFTINRTRSDFSTLTITNAFSPDGDGANDTWGVNDLRFYEGVRISVYDRGGSRLFYSENPDVRWDGTYEGRQLPNGTYFWTIEIGETGEMRRGMLNLLRK